MIEVTDEMYEMAEQMLALRGFLVDRRTVAKVYCTMRTMQLLPTHGRNNAQAVAYSAAMQAMEPVPLGQVNAQRGATNILNTFHTDLCVFQGVLQFVPGIALVTIGTWLIMFTARRHGDWLLIPGAFLLILGMVAIIFADTFADVLSVIAESAPASLRGAFCATA